MPMPRLVIHWLVAVLAALPLPAQAPPPKPRLGSIDFPTSASPLAQGAFLDGVLYLHSFEYESAERAFRRAQQLEPGFAMAHWGEAMTYTHPVLNAQVIRSARRAPDRPDITHEATRSRTPTPTALAHLTAAV